MSNLINEENKENVEICSEFARIYIEGAIERVH